MTQDEIEILHKLISSGSWKPIQDVLVRHIKSLDSLEGVDTSVEADELKLELRARQRAKNTLAAMLNELAGYGTNDKQASHLTRSMK